jgi:hypothetical protein
MSVARLENVAEVFRRPDLPRTEATSLRAYLREGSGIFVDNLTGLVTSERQWTALDTVSYWSRNVFLSSSSDDYGQLASNPFATARLEYVARTALKFFQENEAMPSSICDFATGVGEMLPILRRLFDQTKVFATEDSETLCKRLSSMGYEVIEGSLGGQSIKFHPQTDVGFLTWTLCNCSHPLEVLEDAARLIKTGGHLVVADSSRVLVPIKKSASDWLNRNHSADIHPFFFSVKTLSALLECAGFIPVHINRYHDSDVLLIIARYEGFVDNTKAVAVDDQSEVLTFLNTVATLSPYFDRLR